MPSPRSAKAGDERFETGRAGKNQFCVLVADAARARLFVLSIEGTNPREPTLSPLVEIADFANPSQRARDGEIFTESRPGIRREGQHLQGQGQGHGVTDRRDAARREAARKFAQFAVGELASAWSELPAGQLIVVAGPTMLGLLRPALSRTLRNADDGDQVIELARDLTWLSAPALHDTLASHGLLPPRGRAGVAWQSM